MNEAKSLNVGDTVNLDVYSIENSEYVNQFPGKNVPKSVKIISPKINVNGDFTFEVPKYKGKEAILPKKFILESAVGTPGRTTVKDAEDMGFILHNYLNINRDSSFGETYNKIYELEDYTEMKAGAIMLGMRLNEILDESSAIKFKVKSLFSEDLRRAEQSQLFNQLIATLRNFKSVAAAESSALINQEIH